MHSRILMAAIVGALMMSAGAASAATWTIGDNDGYGIGIADGANHPFDGTCDPLCANVDNRSALEAAATDGAQYTDTYSTAHPSYGPQLGTVATFSFAGLGNGWTEGHMEFDMADFQASTFGAVAVTFNGIAQNWAFNDGFPTTVIRRFDFSQAVLATINNLGTLSVVIDRNASADFYGFDYARLWDVASNRVPEPGSLALLGLGLVGLGLGRRRK